MTSRQRVLKVFRQRSSSFSSAQWQMSRRGRSKTACPGQTTELWSACRGELLLQWGEGTSSPNIIFTLQYGAVLSNLPPITACIMCSWTVGDRYYIGSLSCLILCQKHTVDLNWQLFITVSTELSSPNWRSKKKSPVNTVCSLFCTWMETSWNLTAWSVQITVHRFRD